jgi:hypothetical protein
LKQFRKWLEGFDFGEVVASKSKQAKGRKRASAEPAGRAKSRHVVRAFDSDISDDGGGTGSSGGDGEGDGSGDSDGNGSGPREERKGKKGGARRSHRGGADDAVNVDVDMDLDGKLQDEKAMITKKLEKFGKTHKGARARWSVKPNFPDVLVAEAFLKPKASTDATAFDWSVPKLHRIRAYCRETFGWTDAELDVKVDPVIERYASRNAQTRIDNYFISYHDDNRLSKIKSNRMRSAVEQITGKKTKLAIPKKEPSAKTTTASKRASGEEKK